MYTAVILDDEEKGRNSLRKFVTEYCTEIEVIGVAASGEEALEIITKQRPQLLFLDIEIAQASSRYNTTFDLLPDLPKYDYEVIFVTAYEHYALRAIKSHAVGYILKPISIPDLVEAVNATKERLKLTGINDRMVGLMSEMKNSNSVQQRIWIHSHKDIIPVYTEDIIRLEAQGKYTDIHCEQGKMLTSSKNLGEFVEMLNQKNFVKIHRSHLVNTDKILKYSKTDGGTLVMKDKKELPVSRSGKEKLFELL